MLRNLLFSSTENPGEETCGDRPSMLGMVRSVVAFSCNMQNE